MNPLEEKICAFAKKPEIGLEALAMIKVGRDKGDAIEVIMPRVIASLLFRFHGIPFVESNLN